jgi:hypothetical protein
MSRSWQEEETGHGREHSRQWTVGSQGTSVLRGNQEGTLDDICKGHRIRILESWTPAEKQTLPNCPGTGGADSRLVGCSVPSQQRSSISKSSACKRKAAGSPNLAPYRLPGQPGNRRKPRPSICFEYLTKEERPSPGMC